MGVDGFMAKVLQFCGWQLERVSGVPSLELDFKVTSSRTSSSLFLVSRLENNNYGESFLVFLVFF